MKIGNSKQISVLWHARKTTKELDYIQQLMFMSQLIIPLLRNVHSFLISFTRAWPQKWCQQLGNRKTMSLELSF